MMRAARLESRVYEEVEHDLSATSQALTVVMISAIAAGLGQALGPVLAGRPVPRSVDSFWASWPR